MFDDLTHLFGALALNILPAVVFFLALTLKHWVVDYFLVGIERTPFKLSAAATHAVNSTSHLCYLQALCTVIVIFLLFGASAQLLWIAVLDAFVCLAYYVLRIYNWKRNTFLGSTYVRGIFMSEVLRITLTAIVTMAYFASAKSEVQINITALISHLGRAYFDTHFHQTELTFAIISAAVVMLGMTAISNIFRHLKLPTKYHPSWSMLVLQFVLALLILDRAIADRLINVAAISLVVASTFFYCDALQRRTQFFDGKTLLRYLFIFFCLALFVGLSTFIYSSSIHLD